MKNVTNHLSSEVHDSVFITILHQNLFRPAIAFDTH